MRNALIASFSIKINREMEVIIQYEKCLDCKFYKINKEMEVIIQYEKCLDCKF